MGCPAKRRPRVLPTFNSSPQARAYQWSGCVPTRRRSNALGEFAVRRAIRFGLSSDIARSKLRSGVKTLMRGNPIRSSLDLLLRPHRSHFGHSTTSTSSLPLQVAEGDRAVAGHGSVAAMLSPTADGDP